MPIGGRVRQSQYSCRVVKRFGVVPVSFAFLAEMTLLNTRQRHAEKEAGVRDSQCRWGGGPLPKSHVAIRRVSGPFIIWTIAPSHPPAFRMIPDSEMEEDVHAEGVAITFLLAMVDLAGGPVAFILLAGPEGMIIDGAVITRIRHDTLLHGFRRGWWRCSPHCFCVGARQWPPAGFRRTNH